MDTATESQQQIMQRPRDELEETTDKDITEDDFDALKDEDDLKVTVQCLFVH